MRRFLPWCGILAVALAGCQNGSREDRTISFSAAGDQVSFQHDTEGVFVADREGGGLTKIFTPPKDVLAVGSPLWAPKGGRVIFLTIPAPPQTGASAPPPQPDPAGRVFPQQPVVYTCWLRDDPRGGALPQPRELFAARVDRAGLVAAGLAVRWHPDGDRILYLDQPAAGQAVFAFDLASKTSRRIFPAADAARVRVFDPTPDGSRLACLLGDSPGGKDDGLWIGAGTDWWHVPISGVTAAPPVWTGDGRFACSSTLPHDPARHFLWLGQIEGRRVEQGREEKQPIRDIAWRPDGQRIGFVAGLEDAALQVTDLAGRVVTVAARGVRSFAGWDTTGGRLAYTVSGKVPLADEQRLCLLLAIDPQARDVLCVAPGDGKGASRPLVSGLRTTFVRWSPKEEKLSQWFTFVPTHRSPFSAQGGGLQPGDPAALIDARTGKIAWMTVNAHEKAQVGHYHLLKREYTEAWRWYAQAGRERLAQKPGPAQRPPIDDFSLFAWYCLDKLGRHDDAAAYLAEFRKRAAGLLPADPQAADGERRDPRSVLALARDLYAAEIFLSLHAAGDGEAFFRQALADARTDDDRLSAAVVLSQLVLLQGRLADYADLATKTVAPLLQKAWKPQAPCGDAVHAWAAQPAAVALGSLALAPLCRSELAAGLPVVRARELAGAWEKWRAAGGDDLQRLVMDVILERLYRRATLPKEAAAVAVRLRQNPVAAGRLWTDAEVEEAFAGLRLLLGWMGPATVWNLRAGS